ncbi:hypothetical protein DM01DRAFT_1304087 [Hesseltinella vesiculosa]|uniref:Uncharacterized protein n=1 Tax=Hesseltinella vesiculosa TaxID=101127 RepID=A0A1X2GJZ2_9FUNG|nr:hypothetical protein DM01DRAFT_1304087 [Hesseltinella vesiculosa]
MATTNYFKRTQSDHWNVEDALESICATKQHYKIDSLLVSLKSELMKLDKDNHPSARIARQWIQDWKNVAAKSKKWFDTKHDICPQQKNRHIASTSVAQINNGPGQTVHQSNYITEINNKRKATDSNTDNDTNVQVKRGKKTFDFLPTSLCPSVSTNKSRVHDDDRSVLNAIFVIKIDDKKYPGTPMEINESYEENMNDQAALKCLKLYPDAMEFLKSALGQNLAELPRWLWNHGYDTDDKDTNTVNQLTRLILTDFSANCEKPLFPGTTNERTPFAEYVIPVFKYFCATTKLITFAWCEKGLGSQNALAICTGNSGNRRLLDGVGIATMDASERALIESSGEVDSEHTLEDTLKIMECGQIALMAEMNDYRQAAYDTFLERKVIGIQYIRNKLTLVSISILPSGKWACISERSAIVPRNWVDRFHWLQTMELLVRFKDLLEHQDVVTEKLKKQHTGWVSVPFESTIRAKLLM